MNKRLRGLTLSELLVALAIVVIVGSIAVPVVLSLKEGLRGSANAQTIISTALQNARAIAMEKGQYSGVRFQQDQDGNQYAVYITHIPQGSGAAGGMTVYYKAVEGRSPVRLPEDMAVADMVVGTTASPVYTDRTFAVFSLADVDLDSSITDTTSFSVIFDSKGQLVKVVCRMRNRQGEYLPNDGGAGGDSNDRVFNSRPNVENDIAKFIQDDYANLGLGGELSRVQFKIFDKVKYREFENSADKYEYLNTLPYVYVNQYTGKLMGGQ
ncbi:MAG: Tfp pilus assembly protein FimT/FimU [Sedimentisphaeraceae bacterium JB056]